MSLVSFSLAYFLGVLLQTLLVGVFIPLFLVACYVQWRKVSRGQKINLVMALTTAFYGLIVPTHLVLGMRRVIFASLYLPPGVTVEQYLLPPYGADEIARWGIFQLSLVVGDLVMIYRVYHIYDRSFLACVIPTITTSALIAIGTGLTNQLRTLDSNSGTEAYRSWTTACFCVTLFHSVFTSSAICLRLWRMHREAVASGMSPKSDSITLRAIRCLVESAGLWTFFVTANFCAFLGGSDLNHIFLDMTSPVVGISFCLIIVRLGAVSQETRGGTWEDSEPTRAPKFASGSRLSGLSVALDRVKVDRDVYVSDSDSGIDFHMISSIEKPPLVH